MLILTVEKISTGFKNWSWLLRLVSTDQKTKSRHGLCPKISIFVEISIETLNLDTFKSRSRQVLKTDLDRSRRLDLNCSRLLRPPPLHFRHPFQYRLVSFGRSRPTLCSWATWSSSSWTSPAWTPPWTAGTSLSLSGRPTPTGLSTITLSITIARNSSG